MRQHTQPDTALDYRNQAAVPDFNDFFMAWTRYSSRSLTANARWCAITPTIQQGANYGLSPEIQRPE